MKLRGSCIIQICSIFCVLGFAATSPAYGFMRPTSAATSAFRSYAGKLESRLTEQHRSAAGFLATLAPRDATRLRSGDLIVEKLTPTSGTETPGALLHHWRATAFVPGANTAQLERLLRNFNGYPRVFAPQVVSASVIGRQDGPLQASMRVQQKHILTVVMDTTYDVIFDRLDAHHGCSISRSTHTAEITSAGTRSERALREDETSGFLWNLNTYWTYADGDGGLYMQIESVSLTRSIPRGLGWAVGPFVESVPRESLEFTLRAVCNAVRKQ